MSIRYPESSMNVVIAMLRGVNLGSHNRMKMDELRGLCESLKLENPQTCVQSGNVVFRTRAVTSLAEKLESGIERKFGFRPAVILRSTPELRDVIAKNPFAKRRGIDPSRLLVTFLATHPAAEAIEKVLTIKTEPEELKIVGREFYMYFPNGMARPKVSWVNIEKALKTHGTGRNWNTVTKLLEIAETMEASSLRP